VLFNDNWDRAPLDGVVDEIRLYNRILSPTEVRRLAEDP
jgi:hypothetical protein